MTEVHDPRASSSRSV